ncbi:MAG TPA: hypothetical protein VHE32_00710 [Rhodanobacteraceae bacterium]|jgi:hypothetical protein|nr:hypothetical protein [Rhodanobacteraceae bacterium]
MTFHIVLPCAALVAAALAATPAEAATSNRYALSASASLGASPSPPRAAGGRFVLRAAFQVAPAAAATDGPYALSARLGGAMPLVCTPDTIFEDGFDYL